MVVSTYHEPDAVLTALRVSRVILQPRSREVRLLAQASLPTR